jgi:hypothetical protein
LPDFLTGILEENGKDEVIHFDQSHYPNLYFLIFWIVERSSIFAGKKDAIPNLVYRLVIDPKLCSLFLCMCAHFPEDVKSREQGLTTTPAEVRLYHREVYLILCVLLFAWLFVQRFSRCDPVQPVAPLAFSPPTPIAQLPEVSVSGKPTHLCTPTARVRNSPR